MEKQEQLDFYRDWCTLLTEFSAKIDSVFREKGFKEDIRIINKAWERKNLRGMKMLYNDINESMDNYSPHELKPLNAVLMERFGFNLNTVKSQNYEKLKKIMKRGFIRNEKELRLVDNWITEFEDRPDDDKELQLLQRMFSEFIDKLFDSANEKKRK